MIDRGRYPVAAVCRVWELPEATLPSVEHGERTGATGAVAQPLDPVVIDQLRELASPEARLRLPPASGRCFVTGWRTHLPGVLDRKSIVST